MNKKIIIYKLLILLSLILFFFFLLKKTNVITISKYRKSKCENILRLTYLEKIYKIIKPINDKHPSYNLRKLLIEYHNKFPDRGLPLITLPYSNKSKFYFTEDYIISPSIFKKQSEYKVVKLISNQKNIVWGLLELKTGKFGNYYFLVDNHGQFYKIKNKDLILSNKIEVGMKDIEKVMKK